jgi:hypothetical protein
MPTHDEQLKFVIQFATMDLDRLRPGDWLNLRDDLVGFLHGSPEDHAPPFTPGRVLIGGIGPQLPHEYPEDDFRRLQAELRWLLEWVVARRTGGQHGVLRRWAQWSKDGAGELPDPPGVIALQISFSPIPLDMMGHRGRTMFYVHGPTRDVFLYAVHLLLLQERTDRIMCCPECRAIFLRVRKQRYCSRTCTNRANMREWRKTAKGQERESDRNHKRYKARVQRETAQAKVTVARRPRSKKLPQED